MREEPRLTSDMLVSALIRRVQAAGGFAAIVQRGNSAAGAVLVDCQHRGNAAELLEKTTDFEGISRWRRVEPPDAATANWRGEYARKRSLADPDLWWIELDIAGAARFADELLAGG